MDKHTACGWQVVWIESHLSDPEYRRVIGELMFNEFGIVINNKLSHNQLFFWFTEPMKVFVYFEVEI